MSVLLTDLWKKVARLLTDMLYSDRDTRKK